MGTSKDGRLHPGRPFEHQDLVAALYLRWESYSPASLLKMRRSILRFSMVILVRLRYYLLLGPEMLPGFQVWDRSFCRVIKKGVNRH
jgi:hypothetical protein